MIYVDTSGLLKRYVQERESARTLDALHLAAAIRAGGREASILTFDTRQAVAARQLGLVVLGV